MIEPLKEKLVKLILDGIDRDRKGESVSQTVLHGVINSLVDVADKRQKTLVLYESLFETTFIEQTGEYYRKEASILLELNNCSTYMEKVSFDNLALFCKRCPYYRFIISYRLWLVSTKKTYAVEDS